MADSEKGRRTLPGAAQKLLGKTLHVDIQRLTSAIDDLAQQIQEGRKLMDQMFKTLRADINGLSTKLDDTASKADVAGLSAQLQAVALKTDLAGLSAKLDDTASGLSAQLQAAALKTDLAGISTKLDGTVAGLASKSDFNSATKNLKVDIDTINKKIDILLQNKGNTPQPT